MSYSNLFFGYLPPEFFLSKKKYPKKISQKISQAGGGKNSFFQNFS
jgi:hypothetical protein